MLTLTLWNSAETTQHRIELYDHAPVNLTYQFSDVSSINKSKGSYTQTFRIPATKINRNFFGDLSNDASVPVANYSIKRRIRAELGYGTIPLMKGNVQIKNIFLQKKDFADIELIFFGESLDLVKSLQEKDISDLDTSALDHDLTQSNLVASWVSGQPFPFNGPIRYGIMDKGRNWNSSEGSTTPWAFDVDNPLQQGDFTPYIQSKWLVDAIMLAGGYTYSSVFFDSADFAGLYLPAYNGSITPRSEENTAEAQVSAAGLATNFSLTTSFVKLPLLKGVAGGYDFSNNWSDTAYEWTAPYTCQITFTISVHNTSSSTGAYFTRVMKTSGGVDYPMLQVNAFGTVPFTISVLSGDKVWVSSQETSGSNITIQNGTVGQQNITWFRIDSVSEAYAGQLVTMKDNFPELKQIDFLMGLQKMFNLVFVADKNKPKHLIIEPFKDYVSAGNKKDWSNKIDYTKDVTISPTTDIQKNEYSWTHDVGLDFINIGIQQSRDRTYGRYKVRDTDNDFAVGENIIKTPFSPYVMSNIPNTTIAIHRCLDAQGNGIQKPKPKMVYWNNITAVYGSYYVMDDSQVSGILPYFPHFSNYNAVLPAVDNKDLNFGYERAFFAMDSHPLETLYYKYWMQYVNELYSESSRLLTAYVQLDSMDIQDFEFSDKIFIQDSYYRILKISNYDATARGSVQVQFLKIMSDIADCADKPTGQLGNGVITFNGSSSDYGSKTCCVKYGYIWIERKSGTSQCYPTTFDFPPSIV